MSQQPAVLQVVILRDGLLVGTEVFVPGQYTLGSVDGVDLKLDDPSVAASHAVLFFQNGRAAIQDAGSGAVFVNGHRVNACEVRPVDEISCGPFTLKLRVLAQKPAATKPAPAPEVAAMLGSPQPPQARQPAPAAVPPAPVSPAARGGSQPGAAPSTVVSARRMNAAPAVPAPAAPPARGAHLRPVEAFFEDETKTEAIDPSLAGAPLDATSPSRPSLIDPGNASTRLSEAHQPSQVQAETPAVAKPVSKPAPVAARASTPAPAEARSDARSEATEELPDPSAATRRAAVPQPPPAAQPVAAKHGKAHATTGLVAKSVPSGSKKRPMPSIPPATEGKGRPHLFVESYWGDTRRFARSYGNIDPKKKLSASEDDNGQVPMWGFGLDTKGFVFAEQKGDLFRVFVPPTAAVERRAQDGNFYPVQVDSLEVGPGQRRCITLGTGHAVRFTGDQEMTMVAYVQPPLPKPHINPLQGLPWMALALIGLFGSAFTAFALIANHPDSADFEGKSVMPVAVRLIAPPKPEEKKKIEEKIKQIKKEKPKPEAKVEKALPKQVAPETKKALKSLEKLTAAGPAMKDLLAAVDKLGSGPGAKNAKNDFKLSGLLGKAPIANAGIGSFGLGGGGGGGMGIKGAELLRGKGGGGIGALGAGNIGKGSVSGTVTHAVSRSIAAQGTIDKEAVAKAINSHLAEVSSCYERALLKEPGLSGKIVLEWQITTSGGVGYAKTKSSSMKSAAVESCIIASLKTWKFPPAQGAGVVITYPFMFNSVGY